ncbi:PREDICTED: mucin-12-like [Branchiostoma belcheri]|uniref:Mucin-12-like n=1 Tax=Branchiostoma belcheri TaxID=7741 RepID=A0A6P4ZNP1_BRABE|nr:PREDICTED: mucin-12-like [Branchiostoma belcheri]
MAERAQDLPVVSQQGSSPGKDHQVGGPSGQSDSGYYPDSLDQTSPACRQTWKEQTENGATGGAELCDSEGAKEKQSSAELSGSGEQDVPTEQPRKDEDNTRSFPVIGPRVLVNEHVTSSAVPVKPPTTHDGEVAGEADTKKPQQESQPPLSCSSTSRAVPDTDMPGAEADLTSLKNSRIALLSIIRSLEKTLCQARNDLVLHSVEVNPTALHEMLLDTRLEISQASESLLMATGTAHTPETPATNTSDVRKGAPRSKNPTKAHTNLPVSSSSHQNLLVGEDSKTENPVQRGTAPNGTEDPVQVGTAPNSTGDSVQVVTAPNSTEDTVQVVTAPKDTEVSVQVGTAPNSTEKQVQMGTAPNSTEDSVQMVTAHSSTENPIQMVTAPNSTEDSESVQVVTAQNSTEDSVQIGTAPNSTEDLMQVLIALKGTDNSESEQVVTAPNSADDSVQVVTAPNSTEDSEPMGTAPNSTGDSVQMVTAPNSTDDSVQMETAPNSTDDSVQVVTAPSNTEDSVQMGTAPNSTGDLEKVVTAPKSTDEPANNGVLHDNPVNEGHLEDKGKAEILSNSPVMKSHSKPANKDHCHDAGQKKGRKKESGNIKKKDHRKKVTPTPKQLPPDQAVEEDQVDITAIKKVLRQNSLPEGQDDATAEEETLIKAEFEE